MSDNIIITRPQSRRYATETGKENQTGKNVLLSNEFPAPTITHTNEGESLMSKYDDLEEELSELQGQYSYNETQINELRESGAASEVIGAKEDALDALEVRINEIQSTLDNWDEEDEGHDEPTN